MEMARKPLSNSSIAKGLFVFMLKARFVGRGEIKLKDDSLMVSAQDSVKLANGGARRGVARNSPMKGLGAQVLPTDGIC